VFPESVEHPDSWPPPNACLSTDNAHAVVPFSAVGSHNTDRQVRLFGLRG